MKLIHTADLHLDAPIRSGGDFERSECRRREILKTFGRIVGLAESEHASAILIAGDLFDAERITAGAIDVVRNQIESHPEIDFYYLRGNHEGGTQQFSDNTPENLHLFGEELTSYKLGEGIRLYGAENPYRLAEAEPFDPSDCNLAILHGDCSDFAADRLDRTGSLPIARFSGKNIGYLALGHIHSTSEGRLDERGIWCYSGCPNGRGYDECGEKGVLLIEIERHQIAKTFVPLSDRIYHSISVDISGMSKSRELFTAVSDALRGIPTRDAVRLTVCGTRDSEASIDVGQVRSVVPDYFDFRLKDETVFSFSRAELVGEISLRGEFLRLVEASDLDEDAKRRTILWGLYALGEGVDPR